MNHLPKHQYANYIIESFDSLLPLHGSRIQLHASISFAVDSEEIDARDNESSNKAPKQPTLSRTFKTFLEQNSEEENWKRHSANPFKIAEEQSVRTNADESLRRSQKLPSTFRRKGQNKELISAVHRAPSSGQDTFQNTFYNDSFAPERTIQNSFFATLNRSNSQSPERLKKAVSDAALLKQHLSTFDLDDLKRKSSKKVNPFQTLKIDKIGNGTLRAEILRDISQRRKYVGTLQKEYQPYSPIQKAKSAAAELLQRQNGNGTGYNSRRMSVSSDSSTLSS